jgi:hypothetical protein
MFLGFVDANHRLAELVRVRWKNVDALLPRRPAGGLAEIWAKRIVVSVPARISIVARSLP